MSPNPPEPPDPPDLGSVMVESNLVIVSFEYDASPESYNEEDSSKTHTADFRGLLPGPTEFTVMLNLSSLQRDEVKGVRKMDVFKQISLGVALYIHLKLKTFLEANPSNGQKGFADSKKLNNLLKKINVRDSEKMKFFLNLVALCDD
ncbi:hypothetical protein Bca52824_017069 [Brassica carinata]|uniref:Uncharacterized protein n=1 Tax=Brassica carinata TaxID=52824 RepID=A0A8X8AXW7_BRACI|nr:hypothetical protein Bca52824_017069 [Brassica carinata]